MAGVWPYSFSPDGDRIVFAGDRGGVWECVVGLALDETTEAVDKLYEAQFICSLSGVVAAWESDCLRVC